MNNKLIELVNKNALNSIRIDELDYNTNLITDMGYDSLSLMQLIIKIQKEFNIRISFSKKNLSMKDIIILGKLNDFVLNELSDNIENSLVEFLKSVLAKSSKKFTGIGIAVYNDKFDFKNITDLRPDFRMENTININHSKSMDIIAEYAEYSHTVHDGFIMCNKDGNITHVSQYFVPKIDKSIIPDQNHGVRLYSVAVGSLLKGIEMTGAISSNGEIYIYKNGDRIFYTDDFIKKEIKIICLI